MEIDEVFSRLTRRYWHVLLVAIISPAVIVAVLVHRQAPQYSAHTRVALAAAVPKSAAEAAALVSQAHALATSRDVVAKALTAVGISDRDPANIATNHTSVTGNGTSAIVSVSVSDRSANDASAIANRLAQGVCEAFDQSKIGNLPSVISDVDKQLTDLATRRAPIAAQVASITASRHPNTGLPLLQSQLAGIDTLISDLSSDRNRLSEELAAAGSSVVVTSAQLPTKADPKGMAQKVALGALLGLVLGLIIAAASETVRPTVSGAARLGRLLQAPLLGRLDADPAVLQALGRRVRLAARRAGVRQIVVTNASGRAVPEWVVDRVGSVVLEPLSGGNSVMAESPATTRAGRRLVPRAAGQMADGAPTNGLNGAASMDGQAKRTNSRDHAPDIYHVGTLDELSVGSEMGAVGVLVLAGGSTNASAIHEIRDLLEASGWPLLGVVGHARLVNRS
ncbi:MAG TPA: hypothetical protein VGH11_17205 [Jatrophihabitans sp.]